MSAARTERLLNLLALWLNARRPVSLRQMREMDEFAAYATADAKSGERAFERDKAALVELGIPVSWVPPSQDEEDEGGYLIDRARYYLPPLSLAPSELALLSLAGAAAAAISAFPGRAALISALAKLGFDSDEQQTRAPYLAHAPLNPGIDAKRLAAHLETLHEAVASRTRLRLTYTSAAGSKSERDVDPYGLYYRRGAWYLVGFCRLRQAMRTFHLGRIAVVKASGRGADFEVPAAFALHDHVEQRPWEFPSEPGFAVVIRVAARLVPAVCEIFGSRARLEEGADGERLVHLLVSHRAALIAAVLPFGAAAEVLSPPELRAELAAIYADLAAAYAEGGVAPTPRLGAA